MKVLIIGANGAIGKMIVEKMQASSDFVPKAFIRKEEQRPTFQHMGVSVFTGSLEGPVEGIAEAMEGVDSIVFTAGSGAKTGPDKTLTVDLDGAVKSMEAALSKGVKRYVMVSALRADDRNAWETSQIKPYFVAKHYSDRILKESDLDYTILRPGRLLNEPGTGKITIENPTLQNGIPREDVATLALEVLRNDNTIGKIIEFNRGEEPIQDIVSKI